MEFDERRGLYPRWRSQVIQAGYFHAGGRVGVAVSGGADSILLLHFMAELGSELGSPVAVLHYNHGLRGEAADGDEAFVRATAHRLGLGFYAGRGDVAAETRRTRGNLEATARRMRYRFFDSLIQAEGLACVATAHTASDQAETVLLRLLRGTGLRGLSGIYPVLDGKIVRPFLGVTRCEVLEEIQRRGLEYREDDSNRDLRFTRNRVRHQLLPLLEREYSGRIVQHLATLAEQSRMDEALLAQLAAERGRGLIRQRADDIRIDVHGLGALPPALRGRVLRYMAGAFGGSASGIGSTQVAALRRLAEENKSGRVVMLSGGLQARREFNDLIIDRYYNASASNPFSIPIVPPAVVDMPEMGLKIRFQVEEIVHATETHQAYNRDKGEGLDWDRLTGKLTLRNWRAGDAYQPVEHLHPLKIKELFLRQRVPLRQRRLWPVLEDEKGIVWARGFPAASSAVTGPETRRILRVTEERMELASEGSAAE